MASRTGVHPPLAGSGGGFLRPLLLPVAPGAVEGPALISAFFSTWPLSSLSVALWPRLLFFDGHESCRVGPPYSSVTLSYLLASAMTPSLRKATPPEVLGVLWGGGALVRKQPPVDGGHGGGRAVGVPAPQRRTLLFPEGHGCAQCCGKPLGTVPTAGHFAGEKRPGSQEEQLAMPGEAGSLARGRRAPAGIRRLAPLVHTGNLEPPGLLHPGGWGCWASSRERGREGQGPQHGLMPPQHAGMLKQSVLS